MTDTVHSLKEYDKKAEAYRERVASFLGYFNINIPDVFSGRKVFRHHGVIYWPDFAPAMRRSTAWLDRYWPKAVQEASRRSRGVSSSGPVYRAWFAKALRRQVEGLLAPLLIPTTSSVGGDFVSYAVEQRGIGTDRVDDMDPRSWSSLNDPENYTFFRFFRRTTEKGLARILLMPPDFEEFKVQQSALPLEIVALYYAWRTITNRHKAPYDPAQVGVEWAKSGHIFVNWTTFLNSEFRPPVSVHPAQCATFLRGGQVKGQYRLKLSAFPDPLSHETLPEETHAVDPDLFALGDVQCSLIDPLYLVQKDQIFTATYQIEKKRRRRETQKRAQLYAEKRQVAKLEGREVSPTKQAKVYVFNFRVADYPLPSTKVEGFYKWVADTYEEDVYAVMSKGKLFFAEPALLRKDAPPVEREAWFRAMDALSCVAQFAASGDITKVEAKSKIDIARKLQQDEWIKTATERIEGFMSLDDLSKAELRRIKQQTRYRLAESGEGPPGGQSFYHVKLLELAGRSLPIHAVRKEAYCTLLGRNNDEPRRHTFYSVLALKQFAQAAHHTPPAPYIYAWAKFCVHMSVVGVSQAVARRKRSGGAFTPADDLVLLENFRYHPKMKTEERVALMSKLPSWGWKSLQRRVVQLNALLKPALSSVRRQSYTIGKIWVSKAKTEELRQLEYRRLVLVIGLVSQLRTAGDVMHTQIPSVTALFNMTYTQLKQVVVPLNSYRANDFEEVVRKASRIGIHA